MVFISEKESLSDPAAVQENNKSANKEKQITFHLFIPGVYWCVALKSICMISIALDKGEFVLVGPVCFLPVKNVFFRNFCQRENVVFSINICI